MDPLSILSRHWPKLVGLGVIIAVGIYVAILRGNLADMTEERDALQTQQDETVGAVSSALVQLGIDRTVSADTVGDEFSWLTGEYSKLDDALKTQSEALRQAEADAEAVQRELEAARERARKARRERNEFADSLTDEEREEGLTPEEWGNL